MPANIPETPLSISLLWKILGPRKRDAEDRGSIPGSGRPPGEWNGYLPGKLLISATVVCLFLEVSFALSIETNFYVFLFFLTFLISMKLGETGSYCGLEEISLAGAIFIQCVSAQWL